MIQHPFWVLFFCMENFMAFDDELKFEIENNKVNNQNIEIDKGANSISLKFATYARRNKGNIYK